MDKMISEVGVSEVGYKRRLAEDVGELRVVLDDREVLKEDVLDQDVMWVIDQLEDGSV